MKERKLTKNTYQKYCLIIDEWFVNDFNSVTAYKKLYSNVKDSTARVNFSKIKDIPEIANYVKYKHNEAAKIVSISHEGILTELKSYLGSDLTTTINLTADQIKELPQAIKRMITGHKTRSRKQYYANGKLKSESETIELEFFSKEKVVDMINKHVGFYEADNKQKVNDITIHTTNEKHLNIVEKIINGQ